MSHKQRDRLRLHPCGRRGLPGGSGHDLHDRVPAGEVVEAGVVREHLNGGYVAESQAPLDAADVQLLVPLDETDDEPTGPGGAVRPERCRYAFWSSGGS